MRSFKKIAAMFMAVAMLCSFTALGASVEIDDIAEIKKSSPTLDIGYTATDVEDVTVLVYAGESNTLADADVVYIDQIDAPADVADITLSSDGPFGPYTVMMGATGLDRAAVKTFTYSDDTPACDVTVAAATNGYVSCDKENLTGLRAGTVVNFEFTPFLGYKLASLMIGETEFVESVVNGKLAYTVEETVTITPVFEAVTVIEPIGATFTSSDVYDVPADDDEAESKLAFGKAVAASGKTIKNMGMYVEWDVNGVMTEFKTTGDEAYGPYFAAARWTEDNRYGIRFFSFPAGTYSICSYVEYTDGEVVKDTTNAIEFTVQ